MWKWALAALGVNAVAAMYTSGPPWIPTDLPTILGLLALCLATCIVGVAIGSRRFRAAARTRTVTWGVRVKLGLVSGVIAGLAGIVVGFVDAVTYTSFLHPYPGDIVNIVLAVYGMFATGITALIFGAGLGQSADGSGSTGASPSP